MATSGDHLCPHHDPDASMASGMLSGRRPSPYCPVCRGEEEAPTASMMDWTREPASPLLPPKVSLEVLAQLETSRVFRPIGEMPVPPDMITLFPRGADDATVTTPIDYGVTVTCALDPAEADAIAAKHRECGQFFAATMAQVQDHVAQAYYDAFMGNQAAASDEEQLDVWAQNFAQEIADMKARLGRAIDYRIASEDVQALTIFTAGGDE